VSVARQAKLWQWGAVASTVAASLFFAFMPLFAQPNGAILSAYQLLGWYVFLPLLVPLALTLVPALVRGRRRLLVAWVCTGVLGLLCLTMALSWGIVFLPAPLIGAVGAYLTGRAPIEDEEIADKPWRVPQA
jgi:hypothetical protein